MSMFLIVFLSVYSLMHLVVFRGLHPLLKGHPALPTLTWIWMLVMIAAPMMVRFLDRSGYEAVARGVAWVGYSWMGVVFIAFSLCALVGVAEIILWLISLIGLPHLHLRSPQSAILILMIVSAASFYALYEANSLQVETIRIETDKLPPGVDRLRIALVSDIHLGLIHREEALAPIVARIREQQPDILVATGDIVDAQISHLEELISLWQQVDPPLGKFAVTGNHERYAGLEQGLDFLAKSGFTVLRQSWQGVDGKVALAGVDDPAVQREVDEAEVLRRAKGSGLFTVLLKHRPAVNPSSNGLFDLQLSGHAHRGQIFPFGYLVARQYPMMDGLYALPQGGHLYTSRGTGTWGPPMRLLSPPELTIIELSRGRTRSGE